MTVDIQTVGVVYIMAAAVVSLGVSELGARTRNYRRWAVLLLGLLPVPPGLGYLYLGDRLSFSRTLLFTFLLVLAGLIVFVILYLIAIGGVDCFFTGYCNRVPNWANIAIPIAALTPLLLLIALSTRNAQRRVPVQEASVSTRRSSTYPAELDARHGGRLSRMRPWAASLLNVFPAPMGLGYLYLGYPSRFLLNLLASFVAFMLIPPVIALVGLIAAVHAWLIARNHNSEVAERADG